MKKNLVISFLVVLTVINVAALVTIGYHRLQFKGPSHPIGSPSPDMHRNFIQQELGLSQEQAKEFEAHFEKSRIETGPIFDSLDVKREQVMKEISSDKPDLAKLDKLAEEMGILQAQLQKKMIGHLLEGKSLLTPQQQEKLFSLFKEGGERTKGFRGPGGMQRPPGEPDFGKGR